MEGFCFTLKNPIVSVNNPTRPMYILIISISFEVKETELVIPSDNPTVARADMLSKRQDVSGTCEVRLMMIPPIRLKPKK